MSAAPTAVDDRRGAPVGDPSVERLARWIRLAAVTATAVAAAVGWVAR